MARKPKPSQGEAPQASRGEEKGDAPAPGAVGRQPTQPDRDGDGAGEDEAAPRRRIPDDDERARALRLEEVRQYFSDRQRRRDVIHTMRTPLGQQIDWIPIEGQLSAALAEPPRERGPSAPLRTERQPADRSDGALRPLRLLEFELARLDAELGPEGTVPVARRDIDRITTTRSLRDLLSKHGRAMRILPETRPAPIALPEDGTVHKYAYSAQYVDCWGAEGNISAWDPYVQHPDEFSLGQCALARGEGSSKQTIESGHQEYRDLYGDWLPHLFVFFTTNGYTSQGDDKGGYNQDVDGWVQYSRRIFPEALSSPLSAFGGNQYVLSLKWQLWEGNWWLRVNGEWIGYYPATLFSRTGLRERAGKTSWYGEIVDSGAHAGTTQTDMGNGHWPYEGWQRCAFMSNILYQSNEAGGMSRYDPGTPWESHPNCYGIEGHFDNTGSWGPYFWWGGSGKNSACP